MNLSEIYRSNNVEEEIDFEFNFNSFFTPSNIIRNEYLTLDETEDIKIYTLSDSNEELATKNDEKDKKTFQFLSKKKEKESFKSEKYILKETSINETNRSFMTNDERRKEKNKICAKESREREKKRIKEIENLIKNLKSENALLINENINLKQTLNLYKKHINYNCDDCYKRLPLKITDEMKEKRKLEVNSIFITTTSTTSSKRCISKNLIQSAIILCLLLVVGMMNMINFDSNLNESINSNNNIKTYNKKRQLIENNYKLEMFNIPSFRKRIIISNKNKSKEFRISELMKYNSYRYLTPKKYSIAFTFFYYDDFISNSNLSSTNPVKYIKIRQNNTKRINFIQCQSNNLSFHSFSLYKYFVNTHKFYNKEDKNNIFFNILIPSPYYHDSDFMEITLKLINIKYINIKK